MRLSLKTLIYLFAKYSGGFALARWITRRGVVIMGWHGISIEDEHVRFPEFFISQQTLAKRLAYLKRHYSVIPLDQAVKMHAAGEIKPGTCVLTFDDGMYDFTAVGIPLMKAHDVSATVYCVTSYLENNLAASMAVRDIYLRSQQMHGGNATEVDIKDRETLREQQTEINLLPRSDQDAYLLKIAAEKQVDFASVLEKRIWDNMSAEEMKQAVDDGFDVQVHTHTHLTTVADLDRVYDEAATCRQVLEGITEQPATDYCYPSGLWEHAAWPSLTKAGMRSAVTCKTGPNFAKTPHLALRRYIDHDANSQLEFEAMVSGFHWLMCVILKPSRFYEPSIARDEGPPYF